MKLLSTLFIGLFALNAQAGVMSLPSVLSEEPSSVNASSACVDFSGGWEGICNSSVSGEYKDTMRIVQFRCEEIEIDNLRFRFGGTKTIIDNDDEKYSTIEFRGLVRVKVRSHLK